jgi:predicted SnoaL-like aldol condensation-catalyzing enzyme
VTERLPGEVVVITGAAGGQGAAEAKPLTREGARVIADGDLVALHGTYHGFGPDPLIAFDIFRVDADGKLAEHWDALTPLVENTASGRSQTDGPTEVAAPEETEANRALVAEFAQKVLVGADYSVLTDYISTETYDQHNPEAADDLDGFGAAAAKWGEQGQEPRLQDRPQGHRRGRVRSAPVRGRVRRPRRLLRPLPRPGRQDRRTLGRPPGDPIHLQQRQHHVLTPGPRAPHRAMSLVSANCWPGAFRSRGTAGRSGQCRANWTRVGCTTSGRTAIPLTVSCSP